MRDIRRKIFAGDPDRAAKNPGRIPNNCCGIKSERAGSLSHPGTYHIWGRGKNRKNYHVFAPSPNMTMFCSVLKYKGGSGMTAAKKGII